MTKKSTAQTGKTAGKSIDKLPQQLWWISDAPLFIDRQLVTRFHDAVVWPEFENQSRHQQKINALSVGGTLGGEAGAEVNTGGFAEWLVGKMKGSAKVSAEFTAESSGTNASSFSGTIVSNPERKLIELVVEYLTFFRERIVFVDAPSGVFTNLDGKKMDMAEVIELLERPPRPLVFMALASQSPIFPTMVELESGGFRAVFQKLEDKLLAKTNPTPKFSEDNEEAAAYWTAIKQAFDKSGASRTAMQELESACDGHRIGWIDFRVLFGEKSNSAHLHVVPAGEYHTGVFGYNFVHRGYKYGCRLIGTLKSGNDINVLAIYDN